MSYNGEEEDQPYDNCDQRAEHCESSRPHKGGRSSRGKKREREEPKNTKNLNRAAKAAKRAHSLNFEDSHPPVPPQPSVFGQRPVVPLPPVPKSLPAFPQPSIFGPLSVVSQPPVLQPLSVTTWNPDLIPAAGTAIPEAPTLLGLPVEIRRQIYKLLLVNPILGTAACIEKCNGISFGAGVKYNLHPNILAAHPTFHHEATPILYGENTFFVLCLSDNYLSLFGSPSLSPCPLNRYLNTMDFSANPRACPRFEDLPSFSHAKKFRAIVRCIGSPRPKQYSRYSMPLSLLQLCRAMWVKCPQSLEVLILPPQVKAKCKKGNGLNYEESELILRPFKMLRDIGSVRLRIPESNEVPNTHISARKHELANGYVVWFQKLLQGKSREQTAPTVPFKMYEALLAYARTFERCALFKIDMDALPGETLVPGMGFTVSCSDIELNVFRFPVLHPVESGLCQAKQESDLYQVESFKKTRNGVLKFLEPQWRRLTKARSALNNFLNNEINKDCLFDTTAQTQYGNIQVDQVEVDKAMKLLEKWRREFRRETTREVDEAIKRVENVFRKQYFLWRERLMLRLTRNVQEMAWSEFLLNFNSAKLDMDIQFKDILAARRQLFVWDGNTHHGIKFNMTNNELEE